MEQFPFLELVYNVSVLLTLALIYHITPVRPIKAPDWVQQIAIGVILGSAGIVLMYTPWIYTPGIIFDTRSVLLGVSGLFFGAVPTLVAMIMTAVTRYHQGGVAMITGVLVILATGTVSIAWRHLRRRPLTDISARELYLFGVVIHIIMLLLMFVLPWETALCVLSRITLPVLLLYPLATTLLGVLMVNRLRREQIQNLVNESEARYRLLAENTSDVLAVLNVNTERWEYISPSIERLLGYTVEEFLAQPPEQLLNPNVYALIKAQKMKRGTSAIIDPDLPDAYLDEIEQFRKDGSTVWVEVATRYTRNQRGDLLLIGVSRDISERKRVEDALRVSEENFRSVVEEAPIAIFIQTEGRFAYVNKEMLVLFGAASENQLLGKPVLDHFDPDISAQVAQRITQVNEKSGDVSLAEETILRFDGATVAVEVAAVPFIFQDKSGALVFMTDISEKKRSTARAFELALEKERTALLTNFVQEASHEFRTPLSIMQANLYLLKKITIDSERNRKIEQIEQQIVGISRLVEMLTESTRLQNELASPMQTLDLNALIDEVIANFQSRLTANALTLYQDLSIEPLTVSGSANRLYAVLRELMENAVRFTPAGGSIYLHSSICQGQTAVIEIRDTGAGIPAEALPHIFKRFYRQDTAHTTPGLGLGLSIVQSIVEGHGGRIEAESQVGKGSLFRVQMPLAKSKE
ncbi:MAG: PAS domain S-box protein [Caldilineaceae bacterium]|nr:PAS domain S-box protein [Caldilineaceae bacterium]